MASQSKTLTFKVAKMSNIRLLKINKQLKLLFFIMKMKIAIMDAGALILRGALTQELNSSHIEQIQLFITQHHKDNE